MLLKSILAAAVVVLGFLDEHTDIRAQQVL